MINSPSTGEITATSDHSRWLNNYLGYVKERLIVNGAPPAKNREPLSDT